MASSAFAGPQIADIVFRGLSSDSQTQLLNRIGSHKGSELSRSQLNDDIKTLYGTGLFRDVAVDKENVAGGVRLVFRVTEKKSIGKLTITGNKKIKENDLREALKINEGDLLDPAKIAETKRALLKKYEDKGYYLVDIGTHVLPFDEEKGEVELVFEVRENRPVKIRRILFVGNHAFSDKKLRKQMHTKEKGAFSLLSGSGKLKDGQLDTDLQKLRYFYLDDGYLKVRIDEPRAALTRDKQAIYVTVPVSEGEKYKVSSVSIAGDIITSEEEVTKKLSQKVDQTYRKSLEYKDLESLERLYGDQAYAFANIVPQIVTDDSDHTAKITYVIQKGPKVRIGKIVIKGNKITRDKVIRRELKILENAYFSRSALELSRARLYQLGFFEEVNFSTPRGAAEDEIDLVIDVKEKHTGVLQVGGGFSTLESFVFTATVQKDNFFGLGWSGGIQAQISKLRQDFNFSMTDPHFLDSPWSLGVSLNRYDSSLNPDFNQKSFGGGVTLGRELFDFFTLSGGYTVADLKVTDFSTQVPAFFRNNASGLTSAVSVSATYDRRDNRLFTKKGAYVSAGVEYSDSALGATNQYMKYVFDNRGFIPLPLKSVLKGRGMFSAINSLGSNTVSLYNRFFLGGVNTLRGYNISSVGPQIKVPQTAAGGDEVFTYGGTRELLLNVELEVPIYEPIGFAAVGFFDAGNAFAETENVNLSRLRMDYGLGLRWQSPFGPLRFEWGFPINKKTGESSVVFNFSIGQSF